MKHKPLDPFLEALEAVFPGDEKIPPNVFPKMNTQDKKPKAFEPLGEGFARKGGRIYYRVQQKGRTTWLSTKTDKLPQAKKWLAAWDAKQWAIQNGILPTEAVKKPQPTPAAEPIVNKILDDYIQAGQPIVIKRLLKAKAPRSIRNEQYCFRPVREFFGSMVATKLTLNDVDAYYAWRRSGGYIAHFKVRGNDVVKKAKGGDRAVDLELTALSNALSLAVRRGQLDANPIRDRGRFADPSTVRHCREVAPTPDGLKLIVGWMEVKGFGQDADLARYLAYTGLRVSEGLRSRWSDVRWDEELIDVRRAKKGVCPWAIILPETAQLLHEMEKTRAGNLLFPSPFDAAKSRDDSSFRSRLAQAARQCGQPHVTPHGLRSYFVTQARLSGMTDAEIAYLVGDKTGPSLIAQVYGEVRPDHLFAVARKIQITAKTRAHTSAGEGVKTEGGN